MDFPLEVLTGHSMTPLSKEKAVSLVGKATFEHLLMWEAPRPGKRYVVSVDVSGGVGLDRSVIEVTRVGDINEPDEQVAQFISNSIDAVALAPYIDAIGRMYKWTVEELPAMVAIECNGHGLATQTEVHQHYGYNHLFIWRHEDAINPKSRFSRAYGWFTTHKSRPVILARYVKAMNTFDPMTSLPDYRFHSHTTLEELRDFQTPPGMPLWMAEASAGAHDDCIMAGAIGVHVAYTLRMDETEPIHEARRRLAEERRRKDEYAKLHGTARPDFQNTDVTAEEALGRDDQWEMQEEEPDLSVWSS